MAYNVRIATSDSFHHFSSSDFTNNFIAEKAIEFFNVLSNFSSNADIVDKA